MPCSWSGAASGDDKYDETRDWSAEKLYTEAKDELSGGNYKKAIGYYEKLEARYPYGKLAQQAQLEVAYAYFKDKDAVAALAAADRFIKLHPNHPTWTTPTISKGWSTSTRTWGCSAASPGRT